MNSAYRISIVVMLLVVVVGSYRWWFQEVNLANLEDYDALEQIELLLDGKPFPEQIQRSHPYVVSLRIRLLGGFRDISDRNIAAVISDSDLDGFNSNTFDGQEFFQQYSDKKFNQTKLEVTRNGKTINVTPSPPQKQDNFQQFCGLFLAESWSFYSKSTEELEYVIWVTPLNSQESQTYDQHTTPNRIIFRKRFRLVD